MTAGVERERAAGVKVGRWGRGHSLASDELQLVKVKATEWPRCTIFCRLLYLEASLPLQQAESLTAHPVHLPSQVCERYGQPNAMFSLKDHTALVTGGTRGIGQAVAIALAEAGADVILVQRNAKDEETATAIRKLGRRVTVVAADLSSPTEVKRIVPELLDEGREIRILVNCAGIQRRYPCEEFPDEDFNEVIQVNLNSVFTLCRDIGARMLTLEPSPVTGRKGSIINFASLLTFQGGLTVPAYAASKGAVGQLTKSFANEWTSKGITVNAIAPGYIETEMNTALLNDKERLASISARIPAGRWGTPEDFKGTAVYLASKASAYVSGHVLVVDGGWMGR